MADENGREQPIVTTQRAYTLRLSGTDNQDSTWRDRLWNTHEAVNKGAKAFGDWLLTMRGGLCHTLAEADVPGKGNKPARHPMPQEIRNRRVVLALSWLSVESHHGAPESHLVPHDLDMATGERRNWKTVEALREILRGRGLCEEQVDRWMNDCSDSVSATIREDAVWVNRSKAFDLAANQIGASLTREELWDFLRPFFASKHNYLEMETVASVINGDSETDATDSTRDSSEERSKDLSQKAGQWLSSRFGNGTGADFSQFSQVYEVLAARCGSVAAGVSGAEVIRILADALAGFSPDRNGIEGMLGLISGPGYKSATRNILKSINRLQTVSQQDLDRLREASKKDALQSKQKVGGKGSRPYANAILKDVEAACGICYAGTEQGPARHWQYAVILDHAARRVSMAHSWIKRAEEQRSKFEIEKDKLDRVPTDALAWLDAFCARRSSESGASDAYRIRRSAVDGWKQVVAAWAALPPKQENQGSELLSDAESARIQAARELQGTVEKFGDIQLFEALSATGAKCVWQPDSRPDAQPLLDYVAGTDAISKKQRFKVPAYRHPDALLHPVFCDFGNSRWNINYAIHRASEKLARAQQLLEKKKAEIDKAELTLAKAGDVVKQAGTREKINGLRDEYTQQQAEVAWLNSRHAMTMGLWDGTQIKETPLIWQSKRFGSDIGQPDKAQLLRVSRADRFGRAVALAEDNVPVVPSGLFELSDWNGRLQAPRRQLEAIAAIRDSAKLSVDEKQQLIAKRNQSIRWLVTFSAKLQSHGPFIAYAAQHGFDWRYGAHGPENKSRQGWAKLILSRLPGLRLLSVDLGHRYAAACAVWETLSSDQLYEACRAASVETPEEDALYVHLRHRAGGKEKKTIYRRIGADMLPDGSVHPAPWARLDRQFLIKLQGEDRDPRRATDEEIAAVKQMENSLGFKRPTERHGRELLVDELMSDALRTLRHGLQRHGTRARIAFNLTATERIRPGRVREVLNREGRVRLLTETLVMWHELFTNEHWLDPIARNLWDEHVQPLLAGTVLQNNSSENDATKMTRRRKECEKLSNQLKPAAETIAVNDSLCRQLHALWRAYWEGEDEAWKTRLRWMRRWLLPRGIRDDAHKRRDARDVGGLSLTRIASFKSLYQIQKAYRMRPHPEDLERNIPKRADSTLSQFGQRILDSIERMRGNRVKQLASRIVEAALGIGSEAAIRHKDGRLKKRAAEQSSNPRFAQCHAIVIENLSHYRPDETRTRRENRQLMDWSSSKVKKYLGEACQLHGLHLREVSAAYTSRQDSRTGSPGLRCNSVKASEFKKSHYWKKQVGLAQENQSKGSDGNARARYLLWIQDQVDRGKILETESVLIPSDGGELFVSAYCAKTNTSNRPGKFPTALQADLNAAANIGLRALLDPDWEGCWWRILCDPTTLIPDKGKYVGCSIIDPSKPLYPVTKDKSDTEALDGTSKRRARKKSTVDAKRLRYLWRDPSNYAVHSDVEGHGGWHPYPEYWNSVQNRVVNNLQIVCKQLLQSEEHPESQNEDVPF